MTTFRTVLILLAAALALPRTAAATTSEGSLITNLASATFRDNGGTLREISYGATSWVLVVTPSVQLRKTAGPTLVSSGGTVTFCITFSNASTLTSAMNLVLTDKMPDNSKFISEVIVIDPPNASVYSAFSSDNITYTMFPPAAPPTVGQAGPLWLRWTVDVLGPRQSGYVCYSVSIL